ncbi:Diacylglycerol kinase [Sporobacter termitidis DSM 10068]|uniref:Diacylglycerol kinase n=1 Tax=Sporobacter termitidis DSM 10068 TaxID=1123282 RepID=A0A1M5WY05_9FIRM|nr:diacylglycerol kinase family protein [Sporobacter termitidis]SHH92595.1 Diacylglycerol kinase [Sporobacter termitidis DSM 10068]
MKKSFAYAFKGVRTCLKEERNFRFHLAFAGYVVIAGAVTGLTGTEWILVFVCIGAVTGAELFNTAVEKLCDTLHPGRSDGIGRVKDMTAGGVLMAALASAVIGAIIFFNADKMSKLAAFAVLHPILTVLIFATLPPAAFLVFRSYRNDKKNRHDHDRRATERR